MRQLMGPSIALRVRNSIWGLGRFWFWWTGEIAALVPAKARTLFHGDTPLFVRPHPEGFWFQGSDGLNQLVPFGQAPAAFPPALQTHLRHAESAVLLLAPGQVLRRVVELPMAALSDLTSAIPFQLTRQTPFPVENTSYAYRLISRDKAKATLRVELAMTAKSRLDQIYDHLAQMGIHLSATRITADTGMPPLEFETRPDLRRGAWSHEPWKLILAAAICILFLGPALVAWHEHRAADAAAAAVVETAKAASVAEALRHELQNAMSSAAFLHSHGAGPRVIEILRATTASLPDDSWVFNLDYKAGRLRLNGYSANVRSVVERLQAVAAFETIEFPSPIVHDLARKQDRFDILIHVQTNTQRIYAAH